MSAFLHPYLDYIRGGGAGVTFDFYVDSVNGDDSNDGLTAATAFQTLGAALSEVQAGSSIGLARGSHWRETFNIRSVGAASLGVYGTGDPPRIDGAEVVTGWTAEGTANVWQASVVHEVAGSNRATVYEDGQLLTRVYTVANCSSTPGSFVDARGSDGSPWNIRIHPTDSGDPTSNGKVYEVANKTVFAGGPGSSVVGPLVTTRSTSNNGSVDYVAQSDVTLRQILAANGTKHNLGTGSGLVEDCITFLADPPTTYELSNTAFVAYLIDPRSSSVTFRRCFAIARRAISEGQSFFWHGSQIGWDYQNVTCEQCYTTGHLASGAELATDVLRGMFYENARIFAFRQNSHCLVRMSELFSVGDAVGNIGGNTAHLACHIRGRTAGVPQFFTNVQPAVISRSAFVGSSLANNKSIFRNGTASSGTIEYNRVVFYRGAASIQIPTGCTYVGDHNVFFARNSDAGAIKFHCRLGNTDYTTFAAWQAATSQDANSVALEPVDQVAGHANAFWLAYAEAAGGADLETIGPAVGDFRINPLARGYNAAGTAFIGTFADGVTPITEAGPQEHWDWNQRAAVAGVPVAWPLVPNTEAGCMTYISDPAAWDFYP